MPKRNPRTAPAQAVQPIRPGKQPREVRRFDQTSLMPRTYGSRLTRDYSAHFFRWGFAKRFINASTAVLDVGCGEGCPLVHILEHPHCMPKKYVGVDMNPLPNRLNPAWANWYEEFDFVSCYKDVARDHGRFDVLTCLEVIEHMGAADGHELLCGLHACCKPGGTLFLSTPVFNGHAARNHIHEWEVDELRKGLAVTKWNVIRRYGTFINIPALKRVLSPEEQAVYDQLRTYYSDDVLSCFFAPLHPDESRNNVWVCQPA